MSKEERRVEIARIKQELKNKRSTPVRIIVAPGARAPKIFKSNPRVTIEK